MNNTVSTPPAPISDVTLKSRRGFASLTPERRREISSRGGKAAHEKGTAHKWTSEEARVAGSKGGKTPRRKAA